MKERCIIWYHLCNWERNLNFPTQEKSYSDYLAAFPNQLLHYLNTVPLSKGHSWILIKLFHFWLYTYSVRYIQASWQPTADTRSKWLQIWAGTSMNFLQTAVRINTKTKCNIYTRGMQTICYSCTTSWTGIWPFLIKIPNTKKKKKEPRILQVLPLTQLISST